MQCPIAFHQTIEFMFLTKAQFFPSVSLIVQRERCYLSKVLQDIGYRLYSAKRRIRKTKKTIGVNLLRALMRDNTAISLFGLHPTKNLEQVILSTSSTKWKNIK